MKFLIPLSVVAAFASASMAAIEFSEDVAVANLPKESIVLASDFKAAEGTAPDATAAMTGELPVGDVSSAAVTSAQASGSAGSTGTSTGIRGGAVAANMMGGGGGGGRQDDEGAASDDLLADDQDAAEVSLTSAEEGDEAEAIEAVAMPEPTTAVVWSILAACGVFAIRRRK